MEQYAEHHIVNADTSMEKKSIPDEDSETCTRSINHSDCHRTSSSSESSANEDQDESFAANNNNALPDIKLYSSTENFCFDYDDKDDFVQTQVGCPKQEPDDDVHQFVAIKGVDKFVYNYDKFDNDIETDCGMSRPRRKTSQDSDDSGPLPASSMKAKAKKTATHPAEPVKSMKKNCLLDHPKTQQAKATYPWPWKWLARLASKKQQDETMKKPL